MPMIQDRAPGTPIDPTVTMRTPRPCPARAPGWRRAAVLAGAVVLAGHLAACAQSGASPGPLTPSRPAGSPSTSDSPATPGPCPASGVRVTLGEADAAAGQRTLELDLMNCGTVPYTADAYPAIRVLDAGHRAFAVTVNHAPRPGRGGPVPSPGPVRLDPGTGALTFLEWHDIVTNGTPVNGVFLEVVPREGDEPQLVEPRHGIDLGTTGVLTVSPWNG